MSDNPVEPVEPVDEVESESDESLGEGGKKALVSERAARKEAEQRAAELQSKLDEIARANESALERAQREAEEARAEAQAAVAEALRSRVAAAYGVGTQPGADGSPSDADLFLTGADEATLTAQAQRLAAGRVDVSNTPKPDLSQGGSGVSPAASTADQFAAALGPLLS